MKFAIEIETTNGFEHDAELRRYDARQKILAALQDCAKVIMNDDRFAEQSILDTDLGIVLRSPSTISVLEIEQDYGD